MSMESTSPSEHSQETGEEVTHPSEYDVASSPRKHRRSSEADELRISVESQSSTASVDQEFSCGICLNILTLPYTIIPCLHTFDKECLVQWWKLNSNCPTCKKASTSAKSAFQLRAIMDHVYKKRRTLSCPTSGGTSAEIFPLNRGQPSHAVYGDDSDDNSLVSEPQEDPRDVLIWACDACTPNNLTGYTCPLPLPSLTPERLQASPLHGYRRMPLGRAIAMRIPGASDHAQCASCDTYVPLGYPGVIKCGGCSTVQCHNFSTAGCRSGSLFHPRSDVKLIPHTVDTLTTYLPLFLRSNRHEVDRLTNYIGARGLSITDILLALFETMRRQVADAETEDIADEKWGPDAWFCFQCVAHVTSQGLFEWWVSERRSSLERQDGILVARPDCWYGRECRTQTHNDSHAERFNRYQCIHQVLTREIAFRSRLPAWWH
ncbi:hypothetical protein JB92DRAFT_3100544 [Gautieria morchelliformis]|nr:hypothetical protein JB92DRAFT_3100544 [Gautieria morchelliformis]